MHMPRKKIMVIFIFEIFNSLNFLKFLAGAIGGYFTQIAFIMTYFNKLQPDFMNEEKLSKMLEQFIPRGPNFFIPYKAEDLEYYKTLDATGGINVMEDLVKLEDPLYVIINKILQLFTFFYNF